MLKIIHALILLSYAQNGASGTFQSRENLNVPLLVWWTPFINSSWEQKQCSDGNCIITEDRNLIKELIFW